MSEEINFSDELGRLIVMVRMPFPNSNNVETAETLRSMHDGKERAEYLDNKCMTVVNQCIGRAVRHRSDYAAVVLVDQR